MISWKRLRKAIPPKLQLNKKSSYEVLWDMDKNSPTLGLLRIEEKQIVLNHTQDDKEAVHTYFHEVLHALSVEYDVDLTEKQVRALEKGLYWLIKPNNLFKSEE